MYLLFDKSYNPEKLILTSTNIQEIAHMIGFCTMPQYYRFIKNNTKKFQHINKRYRVEIIDQRKFFNKNYTI